MRVLFRSPPMATEHDHLAIETAAVPSAVPGIAKTGRADDALAALVDAIIHMDDQIGLFVRRRGAIAIAGQFAGDQIGIMAEFDPAFERGVVRLYDDALALRSGKLCLEPRATSPARGRITGPRDPTPLH